MGSICFCFPRSPAAPGGYSNAQLRQTFHGWNRLHRPAFFAVALLSGGADGAIASIENTKNSEQEERNGTMRARTVAPSLAHSARDEGVPGSAPSAGAASAHVRRLVSNPIRRLCVARREAAAPQPDDVKAVFVFS
jgi:hypothetical protein